MSRVIPEAFWSGKRPVFIVGLVVVFIAALMMFLVMKEYFLDINDSQSSCEKRCAGDAACQAACGFKGTLGATVNVVLIFVFIMVILGVYFIFAQTVPS